MLIILEHLHMGSGALIGTDSAVRDCPGALAVWPALLLSVLVVAAVDVVDCAVAEAVAAVVLTAPVTEMIDIKN